MAQAVQRHLHAGRHGQFVACHQRLVAVVQRRGVGHPRQGPEADAQRLARAAHAADLAKVKINWHTTHRKSLRENGYWMGRLASATLYGDDPSRMLDYDRLVDAITPADVQAAAQRYLQRDNYVQVVLYPEK